MSDQYPPQYPGSNDYPPPYPGPYENPPQYPNPNQPPYQAAYPSQPMYPPPPPPPPSYAPYPQYAPYGAAPSYGTSGWAIASLICGLVGLCSGLTGIGAVICGHVALNEIKKSNNLIQGRGMAIAGLVLGYLEIVGIVLYIIFVIASIALIPSSVPQ